MFFYSMTLHFNSRLGEKKYLIKIALIRKCFSGVFTPANFLGVGCALPHLLSKPLPIMHVGLLWNVPIKEAENMKLETWDFCSTENGELIHSELMVT